MKYLPYIIDALLLVVLIAGILSGYKKGFIIKFFDLVGFIFSIIAANMLLDTVFSYVKTMPVYSSIMDSLKGIFRTSFEKEVGTAENITEFVESETEPLVSLVEKFGANFQSVKEQFQIAVAEGIEQAADAFYESVVTPLADGVIKVVLFILLLATMLLVVFLVKHIFNLATHLPIIKGANKILGLVFGAAGGVIKVYIICIIISLILPYIKISSQYQPEDIMSRAYVYNLFLKLKLLKI